MLLSKRLSKHNADAFWNSDPHLNEKGELMIIGLNNILVFNPKDKTARQIQYKGVQRL